MGQYLEFMLRFRDLQEVTERAYLEVATLKTASTFMASTKAGAILGGGSEAEIENLRNYGKNLGIAFDGCGNRSNQRHNFTQKIIPFNAMRKTPKSLHFNNYVPNIL